LILQTAIEARDASPDRPTVLVTMDTNLRIRADTLGITSETYESQRVQIDELGIELRERMKTETSAQKKLKKTQ